MDHIDLKISQPRRIPYELTLKYKYTIIQGNSATGKSELLKVLRFTHVKVRTQPSGISIETPFIKHTTTKAEITRILNGYITKDFNTVFIFDEDSPVIYTSKFQEVIQEINAFFILICRDPLKSLPYGIQQIYELHTSSLMTHLASRYPKSATQEDKISSFI